MTIRVQREAFDPGAELSAFTALHRGSGGIAVFIGQMRDFRGADRASGEPIEAMVLDYYPGMAERQLEELTAEASGRWPLDGVLILHRYGMLQPGEAIVLVATASAHRRDAFAACEFLMDWLKTKAPFWKKETTAAGTAWVEAHASDDARAERWKSRS